MQALDSNEQATALRFAHVALPPDATECEPWVLNAGGWRRFFLVREWNIGGIWVSVAGEQTERGDVRRWMNVGGEDECKGSDRRTLIAALQDAGQLLDSLTAPTGSRSTNSR
jgi:hypothetical protein